MNMQRSRMKTIKTVGKKIRKEKWKKIARNLKTKMVTNNRDGENRWRLTTEMARIVGDDNENHGREIWERKRMKMLKKISEKTRTNTIGFTGKKEKFLERRKIWERRR